MEKDPFVSVRIRNSVREKAYNIAKKVKRRLVKSQSFTKFLTLSSRRTGEQSTIYQVFSDIYMARKFDYENYVHYIRSAQWLKKKSRFVIYNLRLGYEICCNRCGSMFDLHVHHTTYRRLYRERMGDLMFL